MTISPQDAARIEAALRAAQARSSGQIVCVLAQASSSYEAMPIVWSAFLALIAPWPLLAFTEISAERIYLLQLTLFFAAVALLSLPAVRMALIPTRVRRGAAHRAALEQFMLRGVSHGPERNGVLIYVSLEEHFARVIADEGAARVISQSQWQAILAQLLKDMKTGASADALIQAGLKCGDLLAEHFPPREGATQPLLHRFHLI
jgi:putative membrane protein